jgi:hypothetical protein
MAVLIEAISVVVRRDSINRCFRGGWTAFLSVVPNATFCADDQLARVGFSDPTSTERFVRCLQDGGLTFVRDLKCIDIAVVDQLRGPTVECDWLTLVRVPSDDGSGNMAAACFVGTDEVELADDGSVQINMETALPAGWTFKNSLSDIHIYVDADEANERLKFLRTENGLNVFIDSATGKEVYRAGS